MHHNVLVSGAERTPLIQASSYVDMWENIIAGQTGGAAGLQGFAPVADTATPLQLWANFQDNLFLDYVPDADKHRQQVSDIIMFNPVTANGTTYHVHESGNLVELHGAALAAARFYQATTTTVYQPQATPFAAPRPASLGGAANLEAALLSHVGASKPERDSYDASIIAEVVARVGSTPPDTVDGLPVYSGNNNAEHNVNAPVLTGGPTRLGPASEGCVPTAWKTANGIPTGTNSATTHTNGTGYTDLEKYMQFLAA